MVTNKGQCQRMLASSGECWFIEVLDYSGTCIIQHPLGNETMLD